MPGKPIIVSSGRFVHLAYRLRYGVQLTIDNWENFGDAMRFCQRQTPRIRASCEIDGIILLERECVALIAMKEETTEGTTTVSSIASRINTSIRAMKVSACRMRTFGLIHYEKEIDKDSELLMIARGHDVARMLSG